MNSWPVVNCSVVSVPSVAPVVNWLKLNSWPFIFSSFVIVSSVVNWFKFKSWTLVNCLFVSRPSVPWLVNWFKLKSCSMVYWTFVELFSVTILSFEAISVSLIMGSVGVGKTAGSIEVVS